MTKTGETFVWSMRQKIVLAAVIAIWFAAAATIGSQHLLVNTGGILFAPIALVSQHRRLLRFDKVAPVAPSAGDVDKPNRAVARKENVRRHHRRVDKEAADRGHSPIGGRWRKQFIGTESRDRLIRVQPVSAFQQREQVARVFGQYGRM